MKKGEGEAIDKNGAGQYLRMTWGRKYKEEERKVEREEGMWVLAQSSWTTLG